MPRLLAELHQAFTGDSMQRGGLDVPRREVRPKVRRDNGRQKLERC